MIAKNTPGSSKPLPPDFENVRQPISTTTRRFLWWFSIGMVLTAGSAFAMKLVEFLYQFSIAANDVDASQGALRSGFMFTISPLVTYLIVAAGFACLFIWSYLQGQYKDVEAPKYRMLEMQQEIDRAEAGA